MLTDCQRRASVLQPTHCKKHTQLNAGHIIPPDPVYDNSDLDALADLCGIDGDEERKSGNDR